MDPITAVSAVASIVTLAQTALSLSHTLYTLGSAISSASEDIQDLAEDLKTFAQSLTLLSRLLEDSKSWYSDDIYLLTAKIIKECAELYEKIDRVLTKLGDNGKTSWKWKVKFAYKEGQIRKLLKRLRDMKGTLATILMSLQVDLQLSLLFQRKAEEQLQPNTISTLETAREVLRSRSVLSKYGHTMASYPKKVERALPSPQPPRALQPFITTAKTFNSFNSLSTPTEFSEKSASASSPQQARKRNLEATAEIISRAESIKSVQSVDSFKSALAFQDCTEAQDAVVAVNCLKSILHAFCTALDALENLILERLKHDHPARVAATELIDILVFGSRAIKERYRECCKNHSEEYPTSFQNEEQSRLHQISVNILNGIVVTLHSLLYEEHDLSSPHFYALSTKAKGFQEETVDIMSTVAARVRQRTVKQAAGSMAVYSFGCFDSSQSRITEMRPQQQHAQQQRTPVLQTAWFYDKERELLNGSQLQYPISASIDPKSCLTYEAGIHSNSSAYHDSAGNNDPEQNKSWFSPGGNAEKPQVAEFLHPLKDKCEAPEFQHSYKRQATDFTVEEPQLPNVGNTRSHLNNPLTPIFNDNSNNGLATKRARKKLAAEETHAPQFKYKGFETPLNPQISQDIARDHAQYRPDHPEVCDLPAMGALESYHLCAQVTRAADTVALACEALIPTTPISPQFKLDQDLDIDMATTSEAFYGTVAREIDEGWATVSRPRRATTPSFLFDTRQATQALERRQLHGGKDPDWHVDIQLVNPQRIPPATPKFQMAYSSSLPQIPVEDRASSESFTSTTPGIRDSSHRSSYLYAHSPPIDKKSEIYDITQSPTLAGYRSPLPLWLPTASESPIPQTVPSSDVTKVSTSTEILQKELQQQPPAPMYSAPVWVFMPGPQPCLADNVGREHSLAAEESDFRDAIRRRRTKLRKSTQINACRGRSFETNSSHTASTFSSDLENKLRSPANNQGNVARPSVPLTTEVSKRQQGRHGGGSQSTKSSANQNESDYRILVTPQTAGSPDNLWWTAYERLKDDNYMRHIVLDLGLDPVGFQKLPRDQVAEELSECLKRMPTVTNDRADFKEVLELRDNIVRVMKMINQQMGLSIAVVGWACTWRLIDHYDSSLANVSLPSANLDTLYTVFSQLNKITGIIARYAVMENLYNSGSMYPSYLTLKPEYKAALINLCIAILMYLSTAFEIRRAETSELCIDGGMNQGVFNQEHKDGLIRQLVWRLGEEMREVVELEAGCRRFRVVIDVLEKVDGSESSESEEESLLQVENPDIIPF